MDEPLVGRHSSPVGEHSAPVGRHSAPVAAEIEVHVVTVNIPAPASEQRDIVGAVRAILTDIEERLKALGIDIELHLK